jgi:hypothetical protein
VTFGLSAKISPKTLIGLARLVPHTHGYNRAIHKKAPDVAVHHRQPRHIYASTFSSSFFTRDKKRLHVQ